MPLTTGRSGLPNPLPIYEDGSVPRVQDLDMSWTLGEVGDGRV